MTTKTGNYTNKKGENRDIDVYVLKEDEGHIEGIDVTKLSPDELKEFISMVDDFNNKMEKLIKEKRCYRNFLKSEIKNPGVNVHKLEKDEFSGKGV